MRFGWTRWQQASRMMALALSLAVGSVAFVLAVAALNAPSARAQSCHGTLVPVTGAVPNEARYSFSCDGPVEGSYTLSATSASGDAVAGTVQTLDPGFVCTLEPEESEEPEALEEDEDAETQDLSSWECVGAVAVGRTIRGLFVAQQDPCGTSLGLLVVTYRGSGLSAKATGRTLLTIDCSRPPNSTTPPSGGSPGQVGTEDKGLAGQVVSGVSILPSIFRAARRGASVAAAVGTRVRFKLSQNALASFLVTRLLGGVRRGGKCVPERKPKRGAKRCTSEFTLGSFTRRGTAGPNGFKFTGRLAGRGLALGEYRFGVTAHLSSGAIGALVSSPRFRIVR
jgi:hypothetical protein